MLEFNENILFKKYIDIVRTCIRDGYALPTLLKNYDVPSMYALANDEKRLLFDKMSYECQGRLYDMLKSRRKVELAIVKGESDFESVGDFWEVELLDFLDVYPVFKDILV